MSGNIAALAGYTGSGTQGLCVVDTVKGNPDDVVSTVWTKDDNTKQLITGTNVVELESSSGKNTFGGIVNFTVPGSDTDIIGGMLLTYDIMVGDVANAVPQTDKEFFSLFFKYGFYDVAFKISVINKIEILVGSQVWQTINSQDILSIQTIYGVSTDISDTASQENGKIRVSLKLPSFSNSINKNNNGYIMSCAPHQDFHVKVYFNKIDKLKQSLLTISNPDAADGVSWTSLSEYIEDLDNVKLYLEYTMLSNYERNMLSNITIPKKVFYTQSITHKTNFKETTIPSDINAPYISKIVSPKISINCDSFSLFCSGLIINLGAIFDRTYSSLAQGGTFFGYKNITATLYLNNTRYSAPISILQNMMFPELENYDLDQDNIFINLSNTPMGCGVPFNRYDNIRIEIEVPQISVRDLRGEAVLDGLLIPGNHTLGSNPSSSDYISEFNEFMNSRPITVTAVGYTTVLYNGGASSITTY